MISVLAPYISEVEAVSSTSVKVFITSPADTTGIIGYTVRIEGDESKSCYIMNQKVELSCEISNLSPGKQYTVKAYSSLRDECIVYDSEASEGKSFRIKPSVPSIVNVEAVSSTSVKVLIRKPVDTTGIIRYTASIKGDEWKSCNISKQKVELSCEISNLSPGTQYTVNAYSWLSNKNIEYQSEASEEKSVWTKPLAPSIVNVTAVSSTSVKVLIKRPEDTTGVKGYTASIKGDGSKSCDMKEEEGEENLSCVIPNLSPGRQYTVKACSWRRYEASSLNCDPEEKIVWTKPLAPSIVNVEAVSSTSVKVLIKKPVDITGIVKYTASIKGDESKSCVIKEEEKLSCEISNLSPGRQYTVSAYSWLGDEASSLGSDPDEKSGWTKPSELSKQPSKGKVGTRSVEVIWSKVVGVDGYQARAVESADGVSVSSDSSTCETDAQASSCTIEDLKPSTNYSVSVRTYKIIPQNQRIVLHFAGLLQYVFYA
ncbi:hypothetical protein Aperf_G00000121709 [Anoplocephala perfoliata]